MLLHNQMYINDKHWTEHITLLICITLHMTTRGHHVGWDLMTHFIQDGGHHKGLTILVIWTLNKCVFLKMLSLKPIKWKSPRYKTFICTSSFSQKQTIVFIYKIIQCFSKLNSKQDFSPPELWDVIKASCAARLREFSGISLYSFLRSGGADGELWLSDWDWNSIPEIMMGQT